MNIIYTAIKNKLLLTVRYPKDNTIFNEEHDFEEIKVGTWEYIKNNDSKICVLTFGRMIDNAKTMDADAVINVRITTSMIMQGCSEIMAYGTAVKLD